MLNVGKVKQDIANCTDIEAMRGSLGVIIGFLEESVKLKTHVQDSLSKIGIADDILGKEGSKELNLLSLMVSSDISAAKKLCDVINAQLGQRQDTTPPTQEEDSDGSLMRAIQARKLEFAEKVIAGVNQVAAENGERQFFEFNGEEKETVKQAIENLRLTGASVEMIVATMRKSMDLNRKLKNDVFAGIDMNFRN